MPDPIEVDVVVVGLGPGGEKVAGDLAEAGLDVVGLDPGLVGGECPYCGCVPSKMMIRAANLLAEARRVDGMSGHASVEPDWAPVARRIREEATDHWDDTVAVERLQMKGGRFVRAAGRITAPGLVRSSDGQEFRGRRGIVLATGSAPSIPPIEGLAAARGWMHKVGNEGLIKLIEDADRGVLVGATSMGPTGGEVLGLLSAAVHAALPVQTLREMMYAYPTIHRGIEDALRELGQERSYRGTPRFPSGGSRQAEPGSLAVGCSRSTPGAERAALRAPTHPSCRPLLASRGACARAGRCDPPPARGGARRCPFAQGRSVASASAESASHTPDATGPATLRARWLFAEVRR